MFKKIFRGMKKDKKDLTKKLMKKFKKEKMLCLALSFLMQLLFFISPYMMAFILASIIPKDVDIPTSGKVLFYVFLSLFAIFQNRFAIFFYEEIHEFITKLIPKRLYFKLFTCRGKAIKKKDFKIIEKEKKELYYGMKRLICTGYCYSVCFEILKALKKGSIIFMGVTSIGNEKIKNTFSHTAHVIYVNDGWVFDTFSQQQFKLEKFSKIFDVKVYKEFVYSDVKEFSYDEFMDAHIEDFVDWCAEHSVYQELFE